MLLNLEDSDSLRPLGILVKGDFSPLHEYITFPLYNQYGTLIGLSGRTLNPNQKKRKYWHSIIPKRRFLFGLNKAIAAIRKQGYAIVTEGQFDVITAHQFDIKNIVCSMGTALTPDQITLLARYTKKVYVVFDNDTAGQKALDSQLTRHIKEGVQIIPVLLPDLGADTDSFLREHGPEKYLKLLEMADPSANSDV